MRLVCLHGTGDAYLTCALARAFETAHNTKVQIVVKSGHRAIPEMFDLPFEINDSCVASAESDERLQHTFANAGSEGTIYVHPSFLRSYARLDQLTVKPSVSQADMYRALLRLSPWSPLERPQAVRPGRHSDALIIPDARSWPNLPWTFWEKVIDRLSRRGLNVVVNQKAWSLRELLEFAAGADWIIGAQCGVMSIACEADFPGKKTFVVQKLTKPLLFGLTETMPYAHVSKFAGREPPLVKHVVVGENWDEAVGQIERPPAPWVRMPLTPGDFLDRFAVLKVKLSRFPAERRRPIEQQHELYEKEGRALMESAGKSVYLMFVRLIEVHDRTFTLLESAVADAFNGALSATDHAAAIRLNKERVEIRQQIDAALGCDVTEVKSYYAS